MAKAGDAIPSQRTAQVAPSGLTWSATPQCVEWPKLRAWIAGQEPESKEVRSPTLGEESIPWELSAETRRVAQWGFRYDYKTQDVDLSPMPALPEWVYDVLQVDPSFEQCILNE